VLKAFEFPLAGRGAGVIVRDPQGNGNLLRILTDSATFGWREVSIKIAIASQPVMVNWSRLQNNVDSYYTCIVLPNTSMRGSASAQQPQQQQESPPCMPPTAYEVITLPTIMIYTSSLPHG